MNDELETGWQDSLPDDLPGEGATDEERSTFYNKMGRPEKDDGYELTLPEGLTYSDEDMKSFRAAAHKMGLSATHAKTLFDWHTNLSIEDAKASSLKQKEDLQAIEGTLKKEWGAAYDNKKELALRAVRTFAGDDADALAALEEGLGNDPRMVKLFNKIGEAITEDKLKGNAPVYTPGENQDAINAILQNLKHPYHDKKAPGHDTAVEHMQKLYSALYPDE
jgi:hypothetical protein